MEVATGEEIQRARFKVLTKIAKQNNLSGLCPKYDPSKHSLYKKANKKLLYELRQHGVKVNRIEKATWRCIRKQRRVEIARLQEKYSRQEVLDLIASCSTAVTESSKHSAGFFSVFVLVSVYMIVTSLSTTHLMILTESSLPVPLLGVNLPLQTFCWALPIAYLILHINLLLHFRMLDFQVREFNKSLEYLKVERDIHRENVSDIENMKSRFKKLLFPFFVNRSLLDGKRTYLGNFNSIFFWWTVFGIPVITLLITQWKFLPYHDSTILWFHRFMVIFDIIILKYGWSFGYDEGSNSIFALKNRGGITTTMSGIFAILVSVFVLAVPREKFAPSWFDGTWDWRQRNLNVTNETIGKELVSIKDRNEFEMDQSKMKVIPILDLSKRHLDGANFGGSVFFRTKFPGNSEDLPSIGPDRNYVSANDKAPEFLYTR